MAIDSITPATTMNQSCSESASDTSGSGGKSRPAGGAKKVKTTEPREAVSRKLKRLLRKTSPGYLTLSLTPSCASAAAAYRRLKRSEPEEVSLAGVGAPRDYLSLSLAPSDQPSRRPGSRDGSGSSDASSVASSSGATERALVVVHAMPSPPSPVQKCLPPKKRKVAAAGVYQATEATASASTSSSGCLALAIVNPHDGASPSTGPPIDAVPLQAVCVRGGVLHRFSLDSGAGKITTNTTAAPPPEPSWIRKRLGLAAEHQLVFIAGKRVHCSDVSTQQSRFMLPRGEINDHLLPLLTDVERHAANLHKPWVRPTPQPSGELDGTRARVQGKQHRGLVVTVVVNRAGLQMDAELTRWDSSGSTVLKFGNAKGFVCESGLTKDDHIQIWAFRQHGSLHLVFAKTDRGKMTAVAPPAEGGQQVA